MWTKKRRAKRRPRDEPEECQRSESEDQEPAETGGVPREGTEEPPLCGAMEECSRRRAWPAVKSMEPEL